jgi:type II secretory ATPase GspE/PulE/Tfp pilus assembly ATPase PilB-like protein
MAGLCPGASRTPATGSIRMKLDDLPVHLRLKTLPTEDGERHLLSISLPAIPGSPAELGLEPSQIPGLSEALGRRSGLVLVTGPAASGRTTTLHSFTLALVSQDRVTIALEHPIERHLPGVVQPAFTPGSGRSWGDVLEWSIDHDPDAITISEVGDPPFARRAFEVAADRLVLAGMRCSDPFVAMERLLDGGVPPGLIVSSLIVVTAQRLVRRLCRLCLTEIPATPEQVSRLPGGERIVERMGPEGLPPLHESTGCDSCFHTGTSGRVGVFEVVPLNETLEKAIRKRSPASRLRHAARAAAPAPLSLVEAGMEKVLTGQVSPSEIRNLRAG